MCRGGWEGCLLHAGTPCVADVLHRGSSQLGCSCPNHRPRDRTGRGRGGGRGAQGGVPGAPSGTRSDSLRWRAVWELCGKACAKYFEARYHFSVDCLRERVRGRGGGGGGLEQRRQKRRECHETVG